jgi:ER-derived vesicles protein
MEQATKTLTQIEDLVDKLFQPIKPYIPIIARFLLVVTFYEDSLRIVSQWGDQRFYLEQYQGMPWGVSHLFLITNVILMMIGSTLAIAKKFTTMAVGMLGFVVVIQSIGYGLLFDVSFFFRNLSVIGGLLMLLSEALAKKKDLFAGLPQISETEKSTYLQLAGRILLVALFVSFLVGGEMTLFRVVMVAVGFAVSILVILGFKAKYSALVLVVVLSFGNVMLNNWWTLHDEHPHRDFRKYDFFQTLSVMGGLLLLFNLGPGGISLDEKKKSF